ncbi:unnamed protein product [Arctogadus glacialis]
MMSFTVVPASREGQWADGSWQRGIMGRIRRRRGRELNRNPTDEAEEEEDEVRERKYGPALRKLRFGKAGSGEAHGADLSRCPPSMFAVPPFSRCSVGQV